MRRIAEVLPANRTLWGGPLRRMLLFKWVLCAALLAAMALCPKLWTSDRAFPTVPAIAGVPRLSDSLTITLAWLLVAAILGVAILPRPRHLCFAVPVIGATLILFDVTRLQPWFYQYMLMFAVVGLTDWEAEEPAAPDRGWAICALILAATYFWSGVQKINLSFGVNILPELLRAVGLASAKELWFLAPIVELSIGLLFLWPRTRTAGVALAVGMHAFLLAALGPFGMNYNAVVWPWNVAMPAMSAVLLFRNREAIFPSALRPVLGKVVGLLVCVMPVLSYFNLWDVYLSFCLYSGKSREGVIMMTPTAAVLAPPGVQSSLEPKGENLQLRIDLWSLKEIGVPSYPEVRAYKSVAAWLRESGVPATEMELFVTNRPTFSQTKMDYRSVK
ncbi:MAG TPA: DoxX family protein [Fimbriimonadaceae bacterium]|nr:DoxX family protein [Fimbriimonadaceae bacterium]